MTKLLNAAALATCFCITLGESAGAANEPSEKPVAVIFSHSTGNYEVECPGTAFPGKDKPVWSVTVEAYRCAKNGRTAFQTYDALQQHKKELTPAGEVNGFMFTGSGLKPIPMVYRVFIHRDKMFLFYRAD